MGNSNLFKIKFKKDLFILFLIVLMPFVFYIYNFVPETKVWSTKYFLIDSGYFNDANYFFWILCVKLMTLMILSIWYITSQFKWKYILLISISIEIYKLLNLYLGLKYGLDNEPFFLPSLSFSIPYILVIIIISKLINLKKN